MEEIWNEVRKLQAENKGKEAFVLLSKHGLLDYCPRLHLRAIVLPCGKRGECFGGNCPRLPDGAKLRFNYNEPYAH